uniref:Uncharacterized protein n=1 Tax=Arundo donax TaxID=35708 RepID=A0A0A9A3B5_ARUDO
MVVLKKNKDTEKWYKYVINK